MTKPPHFRYVAFIATNGDGEAIAITNGPETKEITMQVEKALLDKWDVMTLLGIDDLATMKKYIRDGVLPPRVVLSNKKMGWLKEDIMTWLETRKERRNVSPRDQQNRQDSVRQRQRRVAHTRRQATA